MLDLVERSKSELAADELKRDPSRSNRQIAAAAGCDDKTVGSVRSRLEASGDIPQLTVTVGADGKARPATRNVGGPIDCGNVAAPAEGADDEIIDVIESEAQQLAEKAYHDHKRLACAGPTPQETLAIATAMANKDNAILAAVKHMVAAKVDHDDVIQAVADMVTAKAATEAARKDDDFDWADRTHLVCTSQPALAVYGNPFGAIVIRAEGTGYEDNGDPFITVTPENVPKLIAALNKAIGVA